MKRVLQLLLLLSIPMLLLRSFQLPCAGLQRRSKTILRSTANHIERKDKEKDVSKLPRIFVDQKLQVDSEIQLDEENTHYVSNVMRLKDGFRLRVFNGQQGEYVGQIRLSGGSRDRRIAISLVGKLRSPDHCPPLPCALLFAPIKKTRMKFLLEKAAELGVQHLVPINTQNTQHYLEPGAADAYEKILVQSVEQCERFAVPKLHKPIDIEEAIKIFGRADGGGTTGSSYSDAHRLLGMQTSILVCAERVPAAPATATEEELSATNKPGSVNISRGQYTEPILTSVKRLLGLRKQAAANNPIAMETPVPFFSILIGPEGGFTQEELSALAKLEQVRLVSLGSSILRAETAAISALAAVAAAVEHERYS
ncbi:RNA methyltransferase-domain-containing protein [Ochromonadaceae sp. CCMP2298]|nr:RNA methyltransferase-domain-containing protein [Ochromonadaceae sp. CCMP2298]